MRKKHPSHLNYKQKIRVIVDGVHYLSTPEDLIDSRALACLDAFNRQRELHPRTCGFGSRFLGANVQIDVV